MKWRETAGLSVGFIDLSWVILNPLQRGDGVLQRSDEKRRQERETLGAEEQMRKRMMLWALKACNNLPELAFFVPPLLKSEGKPACFLIWLFLFQLYLKWPHAGTTIRWKGGRNANHPQCSTQSQFCRPHFRGRLWCDAAWTEASTTLLIHTGFRYTLGTSATPSLASWDLLQL